MILSFSNCPNCKSALLRTPKRKTKCINCGNYIYVKTNPETRLKVLVTEKEAEAIDKEWSKYHSVNDNLKRLISFGITKENFMTKKKSLSNSYGIEARDRDVTWALLNEAIIKNDDFKKLSHIYFVQASMLYEEGRDFFRILQQCRRSELLSYKKFKYNKKVKILSGCGCDSCTNLNGKVYTIDEALELMPIPNPSCNYKPNSSGKGWCRCAYISGDDAIEKSKEIDKDFYKDLAKLIGGKG